MLEHVGRLRKQFPDLELHVVGHSAGGIFHAPLVQLLTAKGKIAAGPMKGASGYGLPVASCALWAPACTVDPFKQAYLPAIKGGFVNRFALFLRDGPEPVSYVYSWGVAGGHRKSSGCLSRNRLTAARW